MTKHLLVHEPPSLRRSLDPLAVLAGSAQRGPLTLEADSVIIGSGAGGAVVARTLAEAGESVVVVEEGPYVAPLEHGALRPSQSLRRYWRGGGMTVAFGLGGPSINVTMGRAVGGSSLLTGGVCFRIPEHVLDRWQHQLGLRAFDSAMLEPFYREVETRVHVEEVPASMRSRGVQKFAEGARTLGFDVHPMRRNTKDCNGCGRCNFGCPEGAKLSVEQSLLPDAVAHGARILSEALVSRVQMRGSRAVGVEGRLYNAKDGKPGDAFQVHAKKRVVIAAGAVHTPLVLWNSGLEGISGQVGRNLTVHPAFRVIARFAESIENWKGSLQSVFVDAFEHEKITLNALMIPPAVIAATMPGIGPSHVARAKALSNLAIFGGLIHDEGGGRVVRSPLGREPLFFYKMAREDRQVIPRLVETMVETYFAADAKEVFLPVLGAPGMDRDAYRKFDVSAVPSARIECSSQHPLGSCRMGMTREHSVVDPEGKLWDTRNVWIADGSIVPTSLGVNPQLAIMTLATRIAKAML